MKRITYLLSLLLALPLGARAQEPVPLAHGDVPGEPHHHLKIENECVRAYYVEVPPHEATQLHQHDHDYIYVSLGPSDVMNAPLNKPEVHLVLKDGETHFTRGGFAHVARNLSDAPFRNVTIEFLRPQGSGRNICAEVLPGSPMITDICGAPVSGQPVPFSTILFETDGAYTRLYSLPPTVGVPPVKAKMSRLLVTLDQSEIESALPGESPRTLQGGDLLWFPAGSDPAIKNVGTTVARYLFISFKDSGAAAKP